MIAIINMMMKSIGLYERSNDLNRSEKKILKIKKKCTSQELSLGQFESGLFEQLFLVGEESESVESDAGGEVGHQCC